MTKLVFGLNQSLDGYVTQLARRIAPTRQVRFGPSLSVGDA